MNYQVEILDKPFSKKVDVITKRIAQVKTQKTAKITYYYNDDRLYEIEYGYKSPEELRTIIENHEPLVLVDCYVNNVDWYECELHSINAKNAIFGSDIVISCSKCNGEALFNDAKFLGNVEFRDVKFKKNVEFRGVTFSGDAKFSSSIFFGDSHFSKAIFKSSANFSHSIFNDGTYFRSVTFENVAFFDNVTFNGQNDLSSIIVYDTIIFDGSNFNSPIELSFKRCHRLSIEYCMFEKLCKIYCASGFSSLSIYGCTTTAPFYILFNDKLKHAILHYNRIGIDTNIDNPQYKSFARQFNFLKACYNRNGEYEYEDQAYVEFRRCMRKTKNRFIQVLEWVFLDLVSGYCTKPFYVFYAAVIAIAFFAGLYNIPGTVDFTGHYQGVCGSIYHSVITFFTIGYGDSSPVGWLGLLLTGLEGFVGVFLMSLFTVSFVRKVLR